MSCHKLFIIIKPVLLKIAILSKEVRSIFDTMDFTAEENYPGLMIFIDFQKAFDTREWCFLQRCLESFNFGLEFIRWLMTFYNNIQSCVIKNGITSDYFTLERGVRQGDPLSPCLLYTSPSPRDLSTSRMPSSA